MSAHASQAPAVVVRLRRPGSCWSGRLPDGRKPSTAENPEQIVVRTLAVPTDGLIGEWKLDGNVTDTKNGFTTTLAGSPPFIGAQIGQGLDLTGNGTGGNGGKYVEVSQAGSATLDDLQEGAAYPISAWFNPDATPSGSAPANFWMVVGKTNSQAIGIVYNPAGKFAARHYLTGNVLELATATSTSSFDQWHHVVMVVTKGSERRPGKPQTVRGRGAVRYRHLGRRHGGKGLRGGQVALREVPTPTGPRTVG